MLTSLGRCATSLGHEPGLGSFREAAARAGARALIQCLKPFLDEAATRALDRGDADIQSRDDLRVGEVILKLCNAHVYY